ncbi:MAG TPA: four helix bundle protein [Polyangiaceae bacterium]|nr:four helix bundle protein [Polyangiaceae bacterium]
MTFEVEEIAVRLIEELEPLLKPIKARDRALADQLLRASSSMVLNIGEGNYSDPGNRRGRWFTAAGSANEARLALRVAVARRYFAQAEAANAAALLRSILRILWVLAH